MLSVIYFVTYAECHINALHCEYHYDECRYALYRGAKIFQDFTIKYFTMKTKSAVPQACMFALPGTCPYEALRWNENMN
jgi:hypothetical protein